VLLSAESTQQQQHEQQQQKQQTTTQRLNFMNSKEFPDFFH
jgi:hypothetical protein